MTAQKSRRKEGDGLKAKDYMNKLDKLEKMIKNKMIESQRWKDIAYGITAPMGGERVQSSGNKQKMAEAVNKYVQLESEIDACIDRLADERQEIIRTIEELSAVEYDVLHKHYIQQLDYNAIGDLYEKSYSWATTVHGRALQHLQAILDKKEHEE